MTPKEINYEVTVVFASLHAYLGWFMGQP